MGCGASSGDETPLEVSKQNKYRQVDVQPADKKGAKNKDGTKVDTKVDGGAAPEPSPQEPEKPPPHSTIKIHAKHRLECKFGDTQQDHRQKLWQIIRGQDTIQRAPPAIADPKLQTRVSIRTDFGGDINLILTDAEETKLKKMPQFNGIPVKKPSKKKKKKKQEDDDGDEEGDAEMITAARELLLSRSAPASELQGLKMRNLRGHARTLKVVLLSPNDWLLVTTDAATADPGTAARCTDIRTGLHVGSLDGKRKGCFDPIIGAAFSTDGQQLASIHNTEHMYIWDMNTFRVKKQITAEDEINEEQAEIHLTSVVISPDMKLVACGAETLDDDGQPMGRVAVYDINSGKLIQMFKGAGEGWEPGVAVKSINFHPESNLLVAGDTEGKVVIFDARTGEVSKTFEGHFKESPATPNGNWVNTVVFAPDGATLYSLDEKYLTAWDTQGGSAKWTLPINAATAKEGKTASEVHEEGADGGTGKKNPKQLKYTTVCPAANGIGFLGMTDRKVTVFNLSSGDEIDTVTTKAPVSAMSAGCRVLSLGDMWGNLYLAEVF